MAAGHAEGGSKKLRCQRIGCDSSFTEDDNAEGACVYHPGPIFHDGTKEWSCCKARSYDFSLFLALPGCHMGRHTTEKPQMPSFSQKAPSSAPAASSSSGTELRTASSAGAAASHSSDAPRTAASLPRTSRSECQRCTQNLYCTAQHSDAALSQDASAQPTGQSTAGQSGLQSDQQPASQTGPGSTQSQSQSQSQSRSAAPKPPKWDLNAERTCAHAGCGKKYRERDNQDSACAHHPGPASFHDRKRGWTCCGVFVNEFDEFLSIPPCSRGWHDDEA